jgi:hypothetical protein
MAAAKLIKTMNESLSNCDNPDLILGIKQTFVSFIQTVEVFDWI